MQIAARPETTAHYTFGIQSIVIDNHVLGHHILTDMTIPMVVSEPYNPRGLEILADAKLCASEESGLCLQASLDMHECCGLVYLLIYEITADGQVPTTNNADYILVEKKFLQLDVILDESISPRQK